MLGDCTISVCGIDHKRVTIPSMNTFDTIAAYIAAQPADRQAVLEEIYATVKRAAPKAEEAIKYGMPTFVGRGNLVHFAAMKGHLGFYPTPSAIREFATELAA